jgi:hypothetical protein
MEKGNPDRLREQGPDEDEGLSGGERLKYPGQRQNDHWHRPLRAGNSSLIPIITVRKYCEEEKAMS